MNRSELVWEGDDGRLVYGPDGSGNTIPDFSACGYRGGGVALPAVPVRAEISPLAGGGDDTERLQGTIDGLSRQGADGAGFRGALLIRKGEYRIGGTVTVNASGVVLRGEGDDEDGTVLVGTGKGQRSLVRFEGAGEPEETGTRTSVSGDYVPVGARTLTVDTSGNLREGELVHLVRPSTAAWIHDLGMDRIEMSHDRVRQWRPGEYDLRFERTVESIEGNRVTLDAPAVSAMEARYGGGYLTACAWPGRIERVGIENIRGRSEFDGSIADKIAGECADEDHAWNFVSFDRARDAWACRVTSLHFGYACVAVGRRASRMTIEDCACLDPVSIVTGSRRYSFPISGQMTLVQRCRTRRGRHDYVLHSQACGPNVYLDCTAEQAFSDSGPHHRWAVGTLFDNVVVERAANGPRGGGGLNVQDRQGSGTGHGWAGALKVFWNCRADHIICQKPPTSQNYCIGCSGTRQPGWHAREEGWWESHGATVTPRSLYLTQLRDRLGHDAVVAVATTEQTRARAS